VTASTDQDARLWNVATGKAITPLRVHVAALTGKSFSLDGRWIVTAGRGSAGVWETATATSLLFLRGHEGRLTAAFFVGNERIVTAGEDGTVRTYRCLLCGSTRQLVAIAKAREARIAAAAKGG
jgi:WD40 repeat protein